MIQIAIISIAIGVVGFIAAMLAAQLIDAMASIKPDEVLKPSIRENKET